VPEAGDDDELGAGDGLGGGLSSGHVDEAVGVAVNHDRRSPDRAQCRGAVAGRHDRHEQAPGAARVHAVVPEALGLGPAPPLVDQVGASGAGEPTVLELALHEPDAVLGRGLREDVAHSGLGEPDVARPGRGHHRAQTEDLVRVPRCRHLGDHPAERHAQQVGGTQAQHVEQPGGVVGEVVERVGHHRAVAARRRLQVEPRRLLEDRRLPAVSVVEAQHAEAGLVEEGQEPLVPGGQ
jgi:hypothetical protein